MGWYCFIFDSHCPSTEEYSFLSLSSAATLFTSLVLKALKFSVSFGRVKRQSNRRDGVVVTAYASQLVDLGFIFLVESYQKTLKNGIHSFPAWRSAHRDSVENKPASSLVVSLGKALNGMPPSLCGRQMVWPSSLPVVVAQSDERHANRA